MSVNQTGAITNARRNQVTNGNQDKSIKGWLKAYEQQIAKALPSQIGADRFNRICMTALTSNPKLGECTPASFIGAIMNSAQLGLEPNTPLGEAYLIPYKNKGIMEVQFQVGYKGLIQLARRSGEIAMIKAQCVHQNDDFSYELGLNPTIHHVPAKGDRGPVVAYYAFYKTKDGDFDFEVAYRDEIEAHAKTYSQAYAKGWTSPWTKNFDEMAKKTLIKRVLKLAPLATEKAAQVMQDSTIKRFDPNEPEAMHDLTLVTDQTVYEGDFEEVQDQKTDPVTGEVKDDAGSK